MAFTCLGTGDEGSFYSDSAAQIAIQEVCNFLKIHLNSKVPVIDQVHLKLYRACLVTLHQGDPIETSNTASQFHLPQTITSRTKESRAQLG